MWWKSYDIWTLYPGSPARTCVLIICATSRLEKMIMWTSKHLWGSSVLHWEVFVCCVPRAQPCCPTNFMVISPLHWQNLSISTSKSLNKTSTGCFQWKYYSIMLLPWIEIAAPSTFSSCSIPANCCKVPLQWSGSKLFLRIGRGSVCLCIVTETPPADKVLCMFNLLPPPILVTQEPPESTNCYWRLYQQLLPISCGLLCTLGKYSQQNNYQTVNPVWQLATETATIQIQINFQSVEPAQELLHYGIQGSQHSSHNPCCLAGNSFAPHNLPRNHAGNLAVTSVPETEPPESNRWPQVCLRILTQCLWPFAA